MFFHNKINTFQGDLTGVSATHRCLPLSVWHGGTVPPLSAIENFWFFLG